MSHPGQDFVLLIAESQNRLFGYLVTLLGDLHDARDVLQETNLVLWQKADDFRPDSNFMAWARKCAYYQALAFLRDRKRDPHLFGETVMALLDADAHTTQGDHEVRLALRDCLSRLSARNRRLLQQRYAEGTSILNLAKTLGKKESAVKMALMRIRESLRVCIESKGALS